MLNLKALKAAAEAVSEGSRDWYYLPWHVAEGPDQVRVRYSATTGPGEWLLCEMPGSNYAEFVALANPSTILSLIERCEELEGLVGKASQLASVASDWHLTEVEIDGEMVHIYDLMAEFVSALSKADATS